MPGYDDDHSEYAGPNGEEIEGSFEDVGADSDSDSDRAMYFNQDMPEVEGFSEAQLREDQRVEQERFIRSLRRDFGPPVLLTPPVEEEWQARFEGDRPEAEGASTFGEIFGADKPAPSYKADPLSDPLSRQGADSDAGLSGGFTWGPSKWETYDEAGHDRLLEAMRYQEAYDYIDRLIERIQHLSIESVKRQTSYALLANSIAEIVERQDAWQKSAGDVENPVWSQHALAELERAADALDLAVGRMARLSAQRLAELDDEVNAALASEAAQNDR